MEKLLRGRVVGDEEIKSAVLVEVVEGDAEALARRPSEAGLPRYISECTVAVVAIDDVRHGSKVIRVAIGTIAGLVLAAPDVLRKIPLDIARYHKVEHAVSIEVHESGPG